MPSWVSRHCAYGPATSATRYVLITSVRANVCRTAPPSASSVSTTGALEITFQSGGAATASR